MDNFEPYNVFLAIATNIPQRLKTGFVLQCHIYNLKQASQWMVLIITMKDVLKINKTWMQ